MQDVLQFEGQAPEMAKVSLRPCSTGIHPQSVAVVAAASIHHSPISLASDRGCAPAERLASRRQAKPRTWDGESRSKDSAILGRR